MEEQMQPTEMMVPEESDQDDLYDGLLRDVVSREVARREDRAEGQTVIVEPVPGGESIVVGRKEDLDRFHQFLQQDKVAYREVEVERFPTEPEKVEKVRRMVVPRLSLARERLGFKKPPILGDLMEGLLEFVEDTGDKAGVPFEEKTIGGDVFAQQIDIGDSLDGFQRKFGETLKEDRRDVTVDERTTEKPA